MWWIGPAGPEQDGGPGTDFHAVKTGFVSITPIHVDLTRYQALQTALNGLDSKSLSSVGWWPDGYDRFTNALSALQALRLSLRTRAQATSLFNGALCAAQLTSTLEQVWQALGTRY